MTTISDLRSQADNKLFEGAHGEALSLYTRLVELQPESLDTRLRVADSLTAAGELQGAAVVYTQLARHASRCGFPLRALVALKVLSTLEPQLGVLIKDVADLYAAGSKVLGRGVRSAPPDQATALPQDWATGCVQGPELVAHAQAVAANYEGVKLVYPERLIPIPLLSLLPATEFADVLHAVRLVRARPGTPIIEEGKEGSSFFVLARGSAHVTRDDREAGGQTHLATLHDGAIFGEMSLLTEAPRSATVRADSDCDLLEFDRQSLMEASATIESLTGALGNFAKERLLNNVLATAGVFKPLDRKQRLDLMKRFVAVHAQPGQAFIQEATPGTGLFVMLRGEVSVTKDDGGKGMELATLGPGEAFGEISLLNDEPTTATVVASMESTALFLGREYFTRLMEAVPAIRDYLERVSEDRMMDMRISMVPDEPEYDDEPSGELEVDVEVLI